MYNLKVKTGGIWYDVDMPKDASIASTFEEAGIAEMSLKGNGTQSIDLPATNKNCNIFGQIQCYQSNSRIPYSRLECRLYNDGLQIFGPGSYCVLLSATEYIFSVSIIGGSCDIFTALKNIDFSEYPDALGTARKWSLSFQEELEASGIRHVVALPGYRHSELPIIPLTSIRTKLEQVTGYTLPEEIFREGYYISFVDRKRANSVDSKIAFDAMMPCKGQYTYESRRPEFEQYYVNNGSGFLPTNMTGVGLRVAIILKPNDTPYSNVLFKFVIRYNGIVYNINYKLNGTPSTNGFALGYDNISGQSFQQVYYKYVNFWCDGTITDDNGNSLDGQGFIITDVATDPTSIFWGFADYDSVGVNTYAPQYPAGCYLCRVQPLIQHSNEYAEAYGEMNIAANIGFKNAIELYKALAQTFGYITHAENSGAYAYSMANVISRKSSSKDWTSKVIECKNTFAASGYARNNHYSFKEDENNGILVSKDIVSRDEILEESMTVEIGFLSGSNSIGATWCYKEEGKAVWRKLSAPYLYKYTSRLLFSDATDMSQYDTIQVMLQKWLSVEASIVLNDFDILNFDHRTPVFLRQYGRYFYVQKIENYITGQSCSVTLIAV